MTKQEEEGSYCNTTLTKSLPVFLTDTTSIRTSPTKARFTQLSHPEQCHRCSPAFVLCCIFVPYFGEKGDAADVNCISQRTRAPFLRRKRKEHAVSWRAPIVVMLTWLSIGQPCESSLRSIPTPWSYGRRMDRQYVATTIGLKKGQTKTITKVFWWQRLYHVPLSAGS